MKSVLIYTTHKSASMFLHRLTMEVTNELDISYYSINNYVDRKGYYDEIKQSSWKAFIEKKLKENTSKPSCFAPIRVGETQAIFPDALSEYSIILHLRDPRDVLTSLFFSHVYSHKRAKGGFNPSDSERKQWENMGINKFVLDRVPNFKRNYECLISTLCYGHNISPIRYEDMVNEFPVWLNQYLYAFSNFKNSDSISKLHQKLSQKYKNAFLPPQIENIYQNKRKVSPGDHKNKLHPDTIQRINDEFKEILDFLSYT